MFELSPSDTAANANASSIPACLRVSRSKPSPVTLLPAELGVEPPEGLGVLVDDGHRVPVVLEALRQRRADPAASHDHEVHSAARYTVRLTRRAGCGWCGRPCAGLALRIVSDLSDAAKRLLLGRPVRSDRLGHTLLPKRIALPVFASDALSSVAYAPDEILLTLSLAGMAALVISPWVGLAVVVGDARRRRVLPAERARLPVRRRRLRGRDDQPRARTPASPSPARCWSTTSSRSRCRSRRAPSTPRPPSPALRGHEAAVRRSGSSCC